MSNSSDLIYGAAEIARYANITPRALRHLVDSAGFPIFRINSTLAASRRQVDLWVEKLAAAAINSAARAAERAEA